MAAQMLPQTDGPAGQEFREEIEAEIMKMLENWWDIGDDPQDFKYEDMIPIDQDIMKSAHIFCQQFIQEYGRQMTFADRPRFQDMPMWVVNGWQQKEGPYQPANPEQEGPFILPFIPDPDFEGYINPLIDEFNENAAMILSLSGTELTGNDLELFNERRWYVQMLEQLERPEHRAQLVKSLLQLFEQLKKMGTEKNNNENVLILRTHRYDIQFEEEHPLTKQMLPSVFADVFNSAADKVLLIAYMWALTIEGPLAIGQEGPDPPKEETPEDEEEEEMEEEIREAIRRSLQESTGKVAVGPHVEELLSKEIDRILQPILAQDIELNQFNAIIPNVGDLILNYSGFALQDNLPLAEVPTPDNYDALAKQNAQRSNIWEPQNQRHIFRERAECLRRLDRPYDRAIFIMDLMDHEIHLADIGNNYGYIVEELVREGYIQETQQQDFQNSMAQLAATYSTLAYAWATTIDGQLGGPASTTSSPPRSSRSSSFSGPSGSPRPSSSSRSSRSSGSSSSSRPSSSSRSQSSGSQRSGQRKRSRSKSSSGEGTPEGSRRRRTTSPPPRSPGRSPSPNRTVPDNLSDVEISSDEYF